jgi:hypothetical protein
MEEALLGRLVMVLSRAAPEELAAIYRFATGETSESAECGVRSAELKRKSPYVFRKVGSHWRVVFDGAAEFHLGDTLGARYLDYLLHRPNQAVSAFDLEVAIQPEKGEARSRNCIQFESDPQARREYRQALRRLQEEREAARAAGEGKAAERLAGQIEALESALKGGGATDTGERARSNVRLAIRTVMARLEKGGPEERLFAAHLRKHLSLGYECLYSEPQGRIWA